MTSWLDRAGKCIGAAAVMFTTMLVLSGIDTLITGSWQDAGPSPSGTVIFVIGCAATLVGIFATLFCLAMDMVRS